MPSPFPGMDPYLEGPLWTSVHSQIAVEIARQLTPKLVPKYAALTERRVVMALPDVEDGIAISTAGIRPDAAIVTEAAPRVGGAAAVTVEAPVELDTLLPEPVPQLTVEIRDTESRVLVTAIEVLSPWNKAGDGYDEYLAKRSKLLLSSAHLMEIDLLRSGERVPMRQPLPAGDYYVFLSRAGRRPLTSVWPISIRQALPDIPVPLLAGDPDVALNLQDVFENVYDGFGYRYLVDYRQQPRIPLAAFQWEWAQQHLKRQS